jgi:hypothetical protein
MTQATQTCEQLARSFELEGQVCLLGGRDTCNGLECEAQAEIQAYTQSGCGLCARQGGGDPGNGDDGNGDQGNGDQGNGDQGGGDQGNGDEGNGDQGNGDQGTTNCSQLEACLLACGPRNPVCWATCRDASNPQSIGLSNALRDCVTANCAEAPNREACTGEFCAAEFEACQADQ